MLMSLNHVELARAVKEAHERLGLAAGPCPVLEASFVRFPLPQPGVADLNLGFLVPAPDGGKQWLAFGLKSPWSALHLVPARALTPLDAMPAARAFLAACAGASITALEAEADDRIVHMSLSNGLRLRFELFSVRPNVEASRDGLPFFSLHGRRDAAPPAKPPLAPPQDRFAGVADLFSAIFDAALSQRRAAMLRNLRQARLRELQKEVKQLQSLEKKFREQLSSAADIPRLKAEAAEMKSTLHELGPEDRPRAVTAMEKLFAKAKKLQRTADDLKPRLDALAPKLESALGRLAEAQGELTLEEELKLLRPAKKEAPREKKNRTRIEEAGLRQFRTQEGFSVLVGRGHKENEELVMRIAKGNDLWFHLKGRPGAHVVVQVPAKRNASLESLLDGATLAAHFSGIRPGEKVEVDYTARKNVKRAGGGGRHKQDQFLVHYSGNKTLMISINADRLRRLLSGND